MASPRAKGGAGPEAERPGPAPQTDRTSSERTSIRGAKPHLEVGGRCSRACRHRADCAARGEQVDPIRSANKERGMSWLRIGMLLAVLALVPLRQPTVALADAISEDEDG